MSECRELEPLLAPYVDGEAREPATRRGRGAPAACPPCRDAVSCERAVREALIARRARTVRGCAVARPSAPLRRGARRRADGVAGRACPPALAAARRWVPLSLAATLVLAVAGVFVLGLNDAVEALAASSPLDHVKCFKFAPQPTAHADPAARRPRVGGSPGLAAQGARRAPPPSSSSCSTSGAASRRAAARRAHAVQVARPAAVGLRDARSAIRASGRSREMVEKSGTRRSSGRRTDRTYAVVARGRPADLEHVVAIRPDRG